MEGFIEDYIKALQTIKAVQVVQMTKMETKRKARSY